MKGVRVLEVAQWTFVPAAGAVLADWGADVIKVEHPRTGDSQRGLRSLGHITIEGDRNPVMEHANRGKRSAAIDMSTPDGHALLMDIARTSDVFLTNFLPEARKKLRIDVDDVRAVNPRIIYARGSAYGPLGAEADTGGYDMTGFWSRAAGAVGSTPCDLEGVVPQPGPAYGDSIGGMTIAGGIAAALFERERTGHARVVDISLLGVGVWASGVAVNAALVSGEPWAANPAGANVAPNNPLVGFYRTADGRFLSLSMLQGFRYFGEFCRRISVGELADDERFASHEALTENAAAATEILRTAIAARPLSHWRAALEGFEGQWAVVQNTVEVAADPQVRANGGIVDVETDGGRAELVASPVLFDETPLRLRPMPEFAADTEQLILELGGDWDRITALKESGAIA
ncbi:CaiB/BaiF CoA transferase family protein [Mycobacterium shimoidei]|uniref:CaiB/BaiF CoA transferase family protein n=1 Tax=Mycobacterium shimoidei TaxID=29313 RepID=UPI0008495302|nr:CoA transferase [Mycobacterium shimoidei]MCV7257209.1 CoA transferase [Mycobacterium shimoidei]ODR14446.1 carnitine dehydratase [Mycobacterium shimoidei]ORW80523.1 carnitine dehydratase [Mycobacterium shimoidei]